jgi:DNA repair protein RecO (recombination protein O)
MATSEAVPAARCWVLHRRPYRNSSLIVDLLSANSGRIAVVARGGQRDPLLQPFRPLLMRWSGRGELRALREVEADGVVCALQGEALYCGLYLNEMLVRLLHRDDPQPELLVVYEAALRLLAQADTPVDVVLRHFEFRLLDAMGYALALDRDSADQPLLDDQRYRFFPDQGFVADVSGRYRGDILGDIAAGHWHDEARRQARDLMREALAPHLGDRPLVSRTLFRHSGKGAT